MNKKEFVKKLAPVMGFSEKELDKIINTIYWAIVNELISGNDVSFKWFGKFLTKQRQAKLWYDMYKKEKLPVPAYKTVMFKAGKTLKRVIKES